MPRKTFKKIITTPELIDGISDKNKKLIRLFIKDKERKCSPKTIQNYKSDLNIFFVWNEQNNDNKFYPEIRKIEISDFFSYCVDELQWNGKRFARMRSVLSSLSETVIKYFDEDYPSYRNFINSVIEPIPKNPTRDKTVLTDGEIELLINTLKERKEVEQLCFLALAMYSGCRIAELEQFRIDSIDVNKTSFGGVMLETTHDIRCKGFGKDGHVMKKNVIKDLFLPYYNNWVMEREKELKEIGKEDQTALFINKFGDPASQKVFRNWCDKWGEIVGKPIYMHCLRHRFVTYLLSMGLTKDYVIAIVGWASADMVNIYSDIEDKDRDWKDSEKLQSLINEGMN